MSDYDQQWRHGQNVQRINLDSGGGAGILWAMAAIAVLIAVVLVAAFSGGSTTVEHPGGAGGAPIIVPDAVDTVPVAPVTPGVAID